jgi:hypothetical protein
MMDENREPKYRFRLKTLLFVVATIALVLVVVNQQVQINRQRAQIEQMARQIDRDAIDKIKLMEIVRELRDFVVRHK